VAIARALVKESSLILADEPTGILDDEMTGKVMEIFSELHQKGTTIVFATQDANLIQRHPHRVIPLMAGKRGDAESNEGVRSEG
jgi:cell division transport system ATP-binding protein